jgi:ribosomal protein L11 methyltransferase
MVGAGGGQAGEDSAAEEVAALLSAAIPDAAAGVELRPGEIVFWVPRERGPAAESAARVAAGRLAAAGQPIDPARVASRSAAPEAEWRDAWKRHFRTIRLTRQIVVVPSWDRHDPGPDDRVVHLDPGQAFGTGAHESTRLVLRIVQDLADRGARPARVLDLGTGSGILALAAASLWPDAEVVALDSDPIAVAVARENVDANGATGRVAVSVGDLSPQVEGPPAQDRPAQFDLGLANIQADALTSLGPALCQTIAPGGWLVLSGLLAGQASEVADHYCRSGMVLEEIRPGDDDPAWSAVLLRCSASS